MKTGVLALTLVVLPVMAARAHPFDPFAEEKQAALASVLDQARAGETDEAVQQIDAIIAKFPRHAPFYALKAQLLLTAGRAREALAVSDQAVQLAPDHALARWVRGLVRQHQGDAAGAVLDFDVAVAREEDNETLKLQALASRGMALVDLGRFEAGLADLDRAIAARPNAFAERQFRATALLALNRLALAQEDIDMLLAMDPRNARSHRLQAELLRKRGESKQAAAALATAARLETETKAR